MLDSTRDIKAVLIISALFAPLITQATVYNGIDFPDGAASFADVVVETPAHYKNFKMQLKHLEYRIILMQTRNLNMSVWVMAGISYCVLLITL